MTGTEDPVPQASPQVTHLLYKHLQARIQKLEMLRLELSTKVAFTTHTCKGSWHRSLKSFLLEFAKPVPVKY